MHIKLGSKTVIAVAVAAAAASPPGTSGKYLLTTNTDVYIRFDAGTASSANFDLFLPAGGMILVEGIPYVTNGINAIRATANGVLAIQEVD
jgi:hypothetical protein